VIHVGFEALMQLQGVRTTICFVLLMLLATSALFWGGVAAAAYLDFMKWAFGIYVGGKFAYKTTEVAKAKINGTN
jgi:hypothetical protein